MCFHYYGMAIQEQQSCCVGSICLVEEECNVWCSRHITLLCIPTSNKWMIHSSNVLCVFVYGTVRLNCSYLRKEEWKLKQNKLPPVAEKILSSGVFKLKMEFLWEILLSVPFTELWRLSSHQLEKAYDLLHIKLLPTLYASYSVCKKEKPITSWICWTLLNCWQNSLISVLIFLIFWSLWFCGIYNLNI